MEKFTYVNAIDNALNGILNKETVDKLNALKASLSKKSANKGEKKVSEYDTNLREGIYTALVENGRMTCTELIVKGNLPVEEGKVLSTQKVASALKALGDRVTSVTEKGKTYYSAV